MNTFTCPSICVFCIIKGISVIHILSPILLERSQKKIGDGLRPKNYGVKQIVANKVRDYCHNNIARCFVRVAILNPRDDLKRHLIIF
jgi:hypothetical protein